MRKTTKSPQILGLANTPQRRKVNEGNQSKNWKDVPFITAGANNLFPQELIYKYERSSTHRAVINTKHVFAAGKELVPLRRDGEPFKDSGFVRWLNEPNEDGDTLYDVYDKTVLDYIYNGGGLLEYKNDKISHIDVSWGRLSKDGKTLYISPEWHKIHGIKDWKTREQKGIQVEELPVRTTGDGLVYFKSYSPGRITYGIPDYYSSSAANWIEVDYRIPTYNLDKIINGFVTSGFLTLYGSPPEGMSIPEYLEELLDRFTGEGNNSKLVVQLASNDTQAPDFQDVSNEPEGVFTELQKFP
jgi:hypothetical protein